MEATDKTGWFDVSPNELKNPKYFQLISNSNR